jgi:hypothetical protein
MARGVAEQFSAEKASRIDGPFEWVGEAGTLQNIRVIPDELLVSAVRSVWPAAGASTDGWLMGYTVLTSRG